MDVLTIAAKTGLRPRTLRYVIFHAVAAGIEQTGEGKGVRRNFTDFESFALAVAAKMLESGLKRDLVVQCIATLSDGGREKPMMNQRPLFRALHSIGNVQVELADGTYVRLRAGAGSNAYDSGWLPVGGGPPSTDPDFEVLIQMKLKRLRDAVQA